MSDNQDELMSNEYVKSKAPAFIIVFCAGFMMLIQTIASGLAVVGYDDVIRADAKAREAEILNKPDNDLLERVKLLEEEINKLKLLSHEPGGQDG